MIMPFIIHYSFPLRGECRPAIQAARFVSEADFQSGQWVENHDGVISQNQEKRGSFEGAIRILLDALRFLVNDLAFLRIPRKSLKFLTLLFSIPTAPTSHPFSQQQLKSDPSEVKW